MPNYCLNSITITSTQGRNMRQWMDELYEETISWVKNTPPLSIDDVNAVEKTISEDRFDRGKFSLYYCCKPLYKTWTPDWEIENFGTKWDIVDEYQYINVQDDEIHISVETACANLS